MCIRAVRQDDEQRLREGIEQLSKRSRYLRFFSGMKTPPQNVLDKLVNVDGHDHIAWGALRSDVSEKPAIGIVHAFRDDDDPLTAEFSVGVLDAYHGLGLARLLTAVLLLDCRREGYREFSVHILAENKAALGLARSLGAVPQAREGNVTELEIDVEHAIATLRAEREVPGLTAIFDAFEDGKDA
ncbi:GNAT family N-acetyltransferase [Erythrobacter sp. JK5]|nr:GNAT family N-acetyltransferase [Erythrobacter sp. JK5]